MADELPRFNLDFDARHGEAVRVADRVSRITVNNPSPFTFHGTNTYIVGDKSVCVIDPGPEDEAHFSALIDHAPDFAEGWNARATAWFNMGRYGQSVADIQHTLALNPRHFGAMAGFGVILETLEKKEQALEVYRAVLAIHPHMQSVNEAATRLEAELAEPFNSCLANLYHNGTQGMAWHSDAEKDLKKNGAIGSLSFGAERKFSFKHKQTKETVSLILEHGSLLIMKGHATTIKSAKKLNGFA